MKRMPAVLGLAGLLTAVPPASATEPSAPVADALAPHAAALDATALLQVLGGASAAQLVSAPAALPTIPRDLQVPGALRIKRVTSGEDGKSRLDVIELPVVAATPGRSITTRLYATDVELGYGAPGTFIDWHRVTTPRFWILLQGAWEFGTGDGKVHLLKPGDIVLAADTTGEGHTSRNVGDVPSFTLTVRLPAEDSLKPKPNPAPTP